MFLSDNHYQKNQIFKLKKKLDIKLEITLKFKI